MINRRQRLIWAAPKPALAALAHHNKNAKDSDYVLVQTEASVLNCEQRTGSSRKAGAKILEAVPGARSSRHFPKTDLRKVRSLDSPWRGPICDPNVVKIAPALKKLDAPPGGVPAAVAAHAKPGKPRRDVTLTVDVVLHRNAVGEGGRQADRRGRPPERRRGQRQAPGVRHHAEDATAGGCVAALDVVRHVEPVLPRKLRNNIARGILRVPTGATPIGDEASADRRSRRHWASTRASTTDASIRPSADA